MAEAGIRQLRDNLSRYLERVRAGEELVVTDRGRAIARVVPIDAGRAYDRLVAEGVIEPAPDTRRRAPRRREHAKAPVSELLADQRR